MASTKHISFLATKSMNNLRSESMDGIAAQKNQRYSREIASNKGTTRESIHSRWSSKYEFQPRPYYLLTSASASTVRDSCPEERTFRRASEYHVRNTSPIITDVGFTKANADVSRRESLQRSRRWTRTNLEGDLCSPPELPLLRISSFPDMMAASLLACSPDTTPASNSDSFTASDSSSFQGMLGLASEFPQPPSLSPALRRMQSAPWLKDQNAGCAPDSNYPRRRMSHLAERSQSDLDIFFPSSFTELECFSRDDPRDILFHLAKGHREKSVAITLEQVERGSPLDQLREETRTASNRSLSRPLTHKTRTTDGLHEWCSRKLQGTSQEPDAGGNCSEMPISLAQTWVAKHTDGRRNTVTSTPGISLTENPRIIRKVASMQSQAQGKPFPESTGQRSIPKIRSLRLFPPPSYLKQEQTQQTAEVTKPRNWHFLRPSTASKMTGSKSETRLSCVSGAEPGEKRDTTIRTPYPSGYQHTRDDKSNRASGIYENHTRDSAVRLSGLGFANFEPVVASKTSNALGGGGGAGFGKELDKPFNLKQKPKPHLGLGGESSEQHNNSVDTSTSFMDITPERVAKMEKPTVATERKDRVRKFIAKASNGFLVWGRGLAAKRHPRHEV